MHALTLVKYNFNIEKSMYYAFGDAFVCEDNETAKMVAFDPRVRIRCVTLEGDIYSPSGTLSGGSYGDEGKQDDSVLKRVKDLNKLEEELRFTEHKYNELKKDLDCIREKLKQQSD